MYQDTLTFNSPRHHNKFTAYRVKFSEGMKSERHTTGKGNHKVCIETVKFEIVHR